MLQLTWGWEPALYLFLGGMGAGCFIMAAVLFLIDKAKHRLITCVSMWAAFVCLAAGLMLLLAELITPLRGMLMWQSFSHFTSWMTYGAWIVFSAIIVFGLAAVCATDTLATLVTRFWKGFEAKRNGILRVLSVIGLLVGVGVAVYTGVLLMSAPGVPLWNSPLLPVLFTVSALDTGVALVEVVAATQSRREHLPRGLHRFVYAAVVVLVVLELCTLALLLNSLGVGVGTPADGSWAATAALSGDMLAFGALSPYFWGLVVAIGLILPGIVAVVGLVRSRKGQVSIEDGNGEESGNNHPAPKRDVSAVALSGSVGALIGGCALRFLVLMAGIHADPLSDAAATVFQDMLLRLG